MRRQPEAVQERSTAETPPPAPSAPETSAPSAPETSAPSGLESSAPSHHLPEASAASAPEPSVPETSVLETSAPSHLIPEGSAARTGAPRAHAPQPAAPETGAGTEPARQRLALAQAALLSALVAGTPAPEGFDRARLRVQSRALVAKRASVVTTVAPELPEILGADYRAAFLDYARNRPMAGGYRRDALDFAAHLLAQARPEDPAARQRLTRWWRDRAGPTPPSARPLARLTRTLRDALYRR